VEVPSDRPWRGALAGLGAAALFGLSTPVVKGLLPSAGPLSMAGLMYLGSGLGLLLVLPFRPAGREARLTRADLPTLAVITAVGGVVAPVLLVVGLARLPAGQASLLLNLEAPFTIGLAVLFFGESLAPREALGAAVTLGAAALLSGWPAEGRGQLLGGLAVAGACACWALDVNLSQRLAHRDPVAITLVKSLAAGSFNLVAALANGEQAPPLPALAATLATGFLGYGLSVVLYLQALRRVGTARQAAFFATAPFIGAVAAVPLLGEPVQGVALVAGALMVAGLLLLLGARHDHLHQHEPLEHEHAHEHDAHHAHGLRPGVHAHPHTHALLRHAHPHLPDLHHRHRHGG
jgi:drug/metabolite transporter (DMT)-like permease